MYGYRPAEVGLVLKADERPDDSFRVRKFRPGFYDMDKRRSVRVSLGCHVRGATLPVPDLNHGPSILAGCTKRVAASMPRIEPFRIRSLKRFARRFFLKYLQPLKFGVEETFDFYEWIRSTPYPDYRKLELIRVYEDGLLSGKVKSEVKSFVKDENYTDFKHLRGIYSRHDDYKTRVGPFFQKFGDKLFALKWFIKKIPVIDRPQALLDKLGLYANIFCTDFSQFEATFVAELMSIEHCIYRWCLDGHPMQKQIMDLISIMRHTNHIVFKDFDCSLDAKRMSGEMNTSCGNGLMNLILTMYILEQCGNDIEKVDAYFEGDDGIIGCINIPTANLYTQMGANIKIEIPESLATASFCGNVFDPEVLHNVTNPLEASVAFGWTSARKYRRLGTNGFGKLLCCKSLSMLYSYPGCPILAALGRYGLRMTGQYVKTITDDFLKVHSDNSYEYELNRTAIDYINLFGVPTYTIDMRTRVLVEKLYGVTVSQQIACEEYLDGLTSLVELDLPLSYPKQWVRNDQEYCLFAIRDQPDPYFVKTGFETLYYVHPQEMRVQRH